MWCFVLRVVLIMSSAWNDAIDIGMLVTTVFHGQERDLYSKFPLRLIVVSTWHNSIYINAE